MKNDMTKGSPLKLMILFTIPVLIGNVFQNVYNLVDSVIVGQFLGVNALAAVGMTGTLTFLVFGWVNGMASGFGILLAQSFGACDEKRLRHYTVMSVYLCVAMDRHNFCRASGDNCLQYAFQHQPCARGQPDAIDFSDRFLCFEYFS